MFTVIVCRTQALTSSIALHGAFMAQFASTSASMQLDCIRLFRATFTRRHNIMCAQSADLVEMHLPSLPYLGDVGAASEQMTSYVDGLTGSSQLSAFDNGIGRDTSGGEADQPLSSANTSGRSSV